ncbi:uncharacterized protein OCT59_021672 [Rhizophagus irregularis]|uniref:uncharacterized protein n=1 Tax=Rhizophagus irregularis TaxID=588596 RepID=UPI003316753F|nr:hypothetical protein OCT59_021672 [Rhizophagus irregularis]
MIFSFLVPIWMEFSICSGRLLDRISKSRKLKTSSVLLYQRSRISSDFHFEGKGSQKTNPEFPFNELQRS